jgi:hypothetical protein
LNLGIILRKSKMPNVHQEKTILQRPHPVWAEGDAALGG